ncbi:hypothetical protein M3Y95_00966100 [Aphelenchoides besseyi]|nr:hypothetical protein M3Y95_00966100 [Aphelenchoides besseyi]
MGDQYEPIGNLNDVPAVPPPVAAPPPVPPPVAPLVEPPKSAAQAPKSDFQQASAAPQVPEGQLAQSPAVPAQSPAQPPVQPLVQPPAQVPGDNNYEVPQFPPNQLAPAPLPPPAPQAQPLAETQGKKSIKAVPGDNELKTNLQSAKQDPTPAAPANAIEAATLNKPLEGDKSKFGVEEGSAKKKAAKKGKGGFVKSYSISQCICLWLWVVILMLLGGIITAGYLFVIFSSYFNPQ